MIADLNKKKLYGERLESLPLLDLTPPELAQLYAFLVHKYGENDSRCLDPLKELERREIGDDAFEEGKNEGYEEGCQTGLYEGNRYDEGYDDGVNSVSDRYDEGYEVGLQEAEARYQEGYDEGYERAERDLGAV
jgi:hypothetical protein